MQNRSFQKELQINIHNRGRSFYAQTEPPHVSLVLTGLCTFSSPFYALST